jgi:GNAT superfamily N-acetyltransferase
VHFPFRFLYTPATGRVGSNEDAGQRYLRESAARQQTSYGRPSDGEAMVHFALMELTIRDAAARDADAVGRLLADLGYPTSAQAAAARIASFAGNPASRLQVAESSEEGVVGLVATHIVPRLDDDAFTCRITDIVVSAGYRRSGLGSALMAAAEQEARRAGAPRLDLSSGDWRADAHAFYASHGFETRARAFTKRLSRGSHDNIAPHVSPTDVPAGSRSTAARASP